MSKKTQRKFILTGTLFLFFTVFTVMIAKVDVQPIGPKESAVGFASLNRLMFELFGVNLLWYHITDWLGVIAIIFAMGFAGLGVYQLVKRKSLFKVDSYLLLLGVYYILVVAIYVLFEYFVVNYRPIIMDKSLEASYPSSHTMIVICIMGTAMIVFHHLLAGKRVQLWILDSISSLLIGVTVAGRLISGVHWFTDIIGGIILSCALIVLYKAMTSYLEEKQKHRPK